MPTQYFLIPLLCLISFTAYGHGAWVAQRIGEPTIVYGHGASDDAYDPKKLTVIKGITFSGELQDVIAHRHEKNVTLELADDIAAVAFVMDNGYWTQKEDGEWVNQPKNEVEGAKQAGHYLKYGLSIIRTSEPVKPLADFPLQIIPQSDPMVLHAGDALPVQVLLDGQPLANARLITDYINDSEHTPVVTDSNGFASFPIRNQGLNVIATSHSIKLDNDPKTDKRGYFAVLSFELRHDGH